MKEIIVAVIDGKGGGLGRTITEAILAMAIPGVRVVALGTNAGATMNMLAGGAHDSATGENAVCHMSARADLIAGPIAILLANAMMGEITPRMAEAVANAPCVKVLLPTRQCGALVAGAARMTLKDLMQDLTALIGEEIEALRGGQA